MKRLEACVRVGGGVARQIPQGSSQTPDVWETLLYKNPGREDGWPRAAALQLQNRVRVTATC